MQAKVHGGTKTKVRIDMTGRANVTSSCTRADEAFKHRIAIFVTFILAWHALDWGDQEVITAHDHMNQVQRSQALVREYSASIHLYPRTHCRYSATSKEPLRLGDAAVAGSPHLRLE